MTRYRSRARCASADPFLMTARWQSVCPETGRTIQPGEQIAYYPSTRRAYHSESRAAAQVREAMFAKAWNIADANY